MGLPPGFKQSRYGRNSHMAGVAAGVVGAAEVNSQPKRDTKMSVSLAQPATWTYIWVTLAFVYLVGTYLGIIRVRNIGA